jgi:hypothetical protein
MGKVRSSLHCAINTNDGTEVFNVFRPILPSPILLTGRANQVQYVCGYFPKKYKPDPSTKLRTFVGISQKVQPRPSHQAEAGHECLTIFYLLDSPLVSGYFNTSDGAAKVRPSIDHHIPTHHVTITRISGQEEQQKERGTTSR